MDTHIIDMDDKTLLQFLLNKYNVKREDVENEYKIQPKKQKKQPKPKEVKPKKQPKPKEIKPKEVKPKKQPKPKEIKPKVKNPFSNRNITVDGRTFKKIMKENPDLFLMDNEIIDTKAGEKMQKKLDEGLKTVHEMEDKIIEKKNYTCDTHLFTRINKDEANKLKHTHYIIGKDGNYYIHFSRGLYNTKNNDINEYNKIQTYDFDNGFKPLKKILKEDKAFRELCAFREEYIHMILISNIVQTQGVVNENYNPIEEDLMMGESENAIYNQYIKYGLNSNAETFGDLFEIEHSKYVLDNYKQNACYVNLIIDSYRPTFMEDAKKNAKHYNIDLTYDYMTKLCEIDSNNDQLPLTIKKSIKFFEKFKLSLVVMGAFGCIEHYRPESINKKLNPRTLYIYVQNGHTYKVNENIKRLEQVKWDKMKVDDEETTEEVKSIYVSDQYHISDKDKTEHKKIFINNIKELITEIKKLDEKERIAYVIYGGDLRQLLFEMVNEKYYPSVGFGNNNVKTLILKIENTLVIINDNIVRSKNHMEQFLNEQEFIPYYTETNNFYHGVINKDNISKYNPITMNIEKEYKIQPLTGVFEGNESDGDETATLSGIDTRKAYTSDFMDIENYPIYNYFDIFIKYDKSTIKDENQYIIKCEGTTPEELILFRNVYNRCCGYKLNRIPTTIKYEILYYRKPSSLQVSNSKDLVNNLWKSKISNIEQNDITLKKSIVNIVLGKMEKRKNKKTITKLFKNYDEAFYYQSKYGGNVYPICESKEINNENIEQANNVFEEINCVYLLVINFDKELINGFTPIKDMVYEIRSLKNYNTYMKLKNNGIIPVGIHTDSLLFHNKYAKQASKLFNVKKDIIGGYKLEKNKFLVGKLIEKVENKLIDIPQIEVNENNIEDETDNDELNEIINRGNTMIKGLYAGVGKTYSASHYDCENLLFVSPYNKLCQKLRKDGHDAITLNSLLGLGINDNIKTAQYDTEPYDAVCFDEILLYNPYQLGLISNFMNIHKDKKFIATGDCDQRKPFNFGLNNIDKKSEYQMFCINQMFKNQITLKINKRLTNDDDKTKLYNIKNDIFNYSTDVIETFKKYGIKLIYKMEDVKTLNNICYFNFRCQKVNEHIHKLIKTENKTITINKIKYWKGLELICKEHFKNAKARLYTNYRYVLNSINNDKFTIIEPVENIKMSFKTSMLKYFRLPYANTCDSVQGMTIEEGFTIFDCNTPYVDRNFIYTALSRTDDLSKVHIFVHDKKEVSRLTYAKISQYFRLKITGYKAQDYKAGREWKEEEYITENWIITEREKYNNCCPICKKYFVISLGITDAEAKSNITVDRINNSKPHIKSNCRLLCLKCNCSKK